MALPLETDVDFGSQTCVWYGHRRFVQERALSMTQGAFAVWQAYAQRKRQQAYALEQLVVRRSQQLLAAGWDAWWQHVAEAKAQHQLVAACHRRCRAVLLRWVLTAWRERLVDRKAKQQLGQLAQNRDSKTRQENGMAVGN